MRRELPREVFLGEMVVGHKNTKVIKPPSHEQIMRTSTKIADTEGKTYVNYVQSNVNMFYFRKLNFLGNYENIREIRGYFCVLDITINFFFYTQVRLRRVDTYLFFRWEHSTKTNKQTPERKSTHP